MKKKYYFVQTKFCSQLIPEKEKAVIKTVQYCCNCSLQCVQMKIAAIIATHAGFQQFATKCKNIIYFIYFFIICLKINMSKN